VSLEIKQIGWVVVSEFPTLQAKASFGENLVRLLLSPSQTYYLHSHRFRFLFQWCLFFLVHCKFILYFYKIKDSNNFWCGLKVYKVCMNG